MTKFSYSFERVSGMFWGVILIDGVESEYEFWSNTWTGLLTKINLKIALLESNESQRTNG